MNTLLLLIPVSLIVGLVALGAFMWAMRSGQFDDLDGAANRILFDDDDLSARDDAHDLSARDDARDLSARDDARDLSARDDAPET